MTEIDFSQLVPLFLLEDRDGRAMAAALRLGLEFFLEKVQQGLSCALDIETCPEWRLDELAWELGCLYDKTATEEQKRGWIRDAIPIYAKYGTTAAIFKYLGPVFPMVEIEEYWQYGAEPYHFRVTVSGKWSPQKEQWAKKSIDQVKNVRSVFDGLGIGGEAKLLVSGEKDHIRVFFPVCGDALLCGTHPGDHII